MSFEFNITSEDLNQQLTSSYGTGSFLLEPGWYTLKIAEISDPVVADGIAKGFISFADTESGTTFRYYATYGVMLDKDKWRVKQTKDLIIRLCQCTGVSNWKNIVGKEIYANVAVTSRMGKSKTEVDELGMPKMVEYKNNDFAKGKLTEIILPSQPVQEDSGESDGFSFTL